MSVAERILDFPPAVALGLVFALPMLESSAFVGFVAPGEIAVVLGGVLANQHKVSLAAVIVLSILGAIVGDSVGYEVGKRYGARMLGKLPHWLLSPAQLERGTDAIRRLGGKAVFVGRFTTTLRVLVPGLVGMSHLNYRRFLAFNVAGGIVWATVYSLLGYGLGSQYGLVEKYSRYAGAGMVALILIGVGLHVRSNRKASARRS